MKVGGACVLVQVAFGGQVQRRASKISLGVRTTDMDQSFFLVSNDHTDHPNGPLIP